MAARVISPAIRDLVLVGVGGAVGTLARYLLSEMLGSSGQDMLGAVWITSGINVVGAALLGLLVALCAARYPRTQLLLGTGVLGGFTTYSLLAFDAVSHGLLGVGVGVATVLAGFIGSLIGSSAGAAIRGSLDRRKFGHDRGGAAS